MEKYKPYSIDKYNTAIIVPKVIRTNDHLEIYMLIIQQILKLSENTRRKNRYKHGFRGFSQLFSI